jgi:hypothetical protein
VTHRSRLNHLEAEHRRRMNGGQVTGVERTLAVFKPEFMGRVGGDMAAARLLMQLQGLTGLTVVRKQAYRPHIPHRLAEALLGAQDGDADLAGHDPGQLGDRAGPLAPALRSLVAGKHTTAPVPCREGQVCWLVSWVACL